MKKKPKFQIRDNSRIILGLTGLIGSGCSALANALAFDFMPSLKRYIESYDDALIVKLFEEINSLKQVQSNIACEDDLICKNNKLKEELEKREIVNVLKRHQSGLPSNNFLYISFSSMIMFYVIRHLNDSTDTDLKSLVQNNLGKIGFTLEDAIALTNVFLKRHSLKNDETKKARLIKLFSNFHIIRDEIVRCKGRETLQNLGDNVRKFGNPFPGNKTKPRQMFTGRWLSSIIDRYMRLRTEHKHFVIECFRNPQELYYFREKYSYFYLLAISAERELRLKRSGLIEDEFNKVDQREADPMHSNNMCELDVGRCVDMADIVMPNNSSIEVLFARMLRYTAMILEPGSIKPTQDETLMHTAYVLSARSNCLSRQVGAVIVNPDGYIIGAGWNDVGEGQLSCGIKLGKDYNNQYLKSDIEINSEEKELYMCLKNKYATSNALKNKKLGESDFCPVLHAEENAILQLAKYHSGIIQNGTMYATTFPCTNCLKKISQVGINTIIFSELYINPLMEFYIKQSIKNIKLKQFEGVKSYSFFKLFKSYYNKKEQQLYLKER